MQNIKISIHNRNLEARRGSISNWNISPQDKKALIIFLNDLELGKVNKGTRITENRQVKYLEILKISLQYFFSHFKKEAKTITVKEMEQFQKELLNNKLKSSFKNKPYSPSTKADISRLLKIYLKWRIGDTEQYRKLTDWFDFKIPKKTVEYLSEAEIEKLYKSCKNGAERFLIALLFDSGARAEEFHNIRYEDIQLPQGNNNFVKLTLKEEYSKTEGRTISLFWKYSLEATREYLNERQTEGIKSNEVIFKNSYENSRQVLYRLGLKVLNKPIHYHLFRHSSATYYAVKMNRQELCYRFGWKFSSDMPDVYISRSGMQNKKLDEAFNTTELEEIQRQLNKERQSNEIKLELLNKKLDMLTKVLTNDFKIEPSFMLSKEDKKIFNS